MLAIGTR